MAYRELVFHSRAREKLLEGINALADAIRITLGPKSKSVLIQQAFGVPLVCNDGVTIARQARWRDTIADLGAQMLRQAAERTAESVGDGTSTSAILAHSLFADGVRNVTAGASAIDLRRGMLRALDIAVMELHALSRPVHARLEKAQVATISAHNDTAIGEWVAQAFERVGDDGVISVEESKTTETSLEIVEGMQFDRGYLSHYFVTDTEKMQAVLEQPYLLVCDRKLNVLADLVTLLEHVARAGKPLLVIAQEVEGEALATLVLNQLRGVLKSAAVRAPGFGDRRGDWLQDIATLTGAQVIGETVGLDIKDVVIEHLGRADRVVVDREKTTVVGGRGDPDAIRGRAASLAKQADDAASEYERDLLRKRVAQLAGGVAVIRVGAPIESEMKAKRDAIEDAIAATRAAVQEGIVPGGGLALLRCMRRLEQEEASCEGDERTGIRMVRRALSAPARQIAENSGVDGGVVVAQMLASEGSIGFDAASQTYGDLMSAGIVDPTKVVRVALENAVSVAGTLLLSEAVMVILPEESHDTETSE